ncbi:AraC family transcriptional regulator [Rhizobium sp. XQZ8]|nr:AraC family transcriptional regulator [Rhizobium populisoli]
MTNPMDEIRDLVSRNAAGRRTETAVPRLAIMKGDNPTGMMPSVYEPMLCLVLQGSKCVVIGDQAMHYDSASYFVSSVEIPASGQIVDASPERPYLALSLTLNMTAIAEILLDMPDDPVVCIGACFGTSPVTPDLAEAWLRLARLIERPQEVRVLGPLIEREILYRLLQGPQGAAIRQLARPESRLGHIRRAIGHIRSNFDAPLRVDELARVAGMSMSVFHRHFKDVTAMSPIQYQKSIRLHEARRRLVGEVGDTARVAFSVGYESVTQFSREYSRQFGASPARDARQLRERMAVEPEMIEG